MMPRATDERERLMARAQATLELRRRDIDKRAKAWIASHRRGPMFWLRSLTKTENYHWREQGLEPVAPFPFWPWTDRDRKIDLSCLPFKHEFGIGEPCKLCSDLGFSTCQPDYLDVVMGYLLNRKLLWIPKTREMMTSWLVVGFITWYCQFFEKTEAYSQSESDAKAQGLIKYADILYTHQDEWLRNCYPLRRGDAGTLHDIVWANGSSFNALPSGERKLASAHPTVYFMDEAAHIPAAEATINIAMPAVRQIIAVSSVAPGWFADTCGC